MKRLCLIVLLIVAFAENAFALAIPQLSARVTDLAGVLSEGERARLEQLLAQQEQQTSNQIAILLIPSLENENLEDYTNRVFEAWKLGQKQKNNGVLVLVAVQDRQLRIEVGYGLEGKLTDALSDQIIRHRITPYFKNGQYGQGLESGAIAIAQVIKGEYKAEPTNTKSTGGGNDWILNAILIIVILFIILRMSGGGGPRGRGMRRRPWWGGGGFYGGGGGGGFFGGGGGFSGGGGGGGFSGGGGSSGGGGASGRW